MLRPAVAADAPALAALVNAAYGHYVERIGGPPRPMTDDYAEVIETKDAIVAEVRGEIAGLVVLDETDEGFLVDNVAVAPDRQGEGVGRALLVHAEAAARSAGYESIYLYTHSLMSENLALYGRIGYAEFDRRDHGGAQIVYLRKELRTDRGRLA